MDTKLLLELYGFIRKYGNVSDVPDMNSFQVGKGIDAMKSKVEKIQEVLECSGYDDLSTYLTDVQTALTECLMKMSREASDSIYECHIEKYGRKGEGDLSVIRDELQTIVNSLNRLYSIVYDDYLTSGTANPKILKVLPAPDYDLYPTEIPPTPPSIKI